MAPSAFFLNSEDGRPGQRFCIFHPPAGASGVARAALVHLHPFAEEMNKSRRMAALQARALSAAGCAVLRIDLHGCGDSSGDFGDADWESWLADVQRACAWLRTQTDAPLWLWGLRAGCLLATEAASRLDEPVNFLFWQPVLSGKQYLQQFLRLKTAGEMLGGEMSGGEGEAGSGSGNVTAPGGGIAALRLQLAQGEAVEVAGYRLSPGLAAELEGAELAPPAGATRVEWLEVAAKAEPALLPVSARRIEQWQAAGHRVRAMAVNGPAFWMTSEIAEAPALIEATVNAIAAATDAEPVELAEPRA